jgi:alpha-mannosidase
MNSLFKEVMARRGPQHLRTTIRGETMYFTEEKLKRYAAELQPHVYRQKLPIRSFRYFRGDPGNAQRVDFNDSSWEEFHVGQRWGGRDFTAWFRARLEIPADWKGERVGLFLRLGDVRDSDLSGPEALLYVNGNALQGLDRYHSEAVLPQDSVEKDDIAIAIKAFSGLQNSDFLFDAAWLVRIDNDAEGKVEIPPFSFL